MGWMTKLIERHTEKAKCLVCENTVPKDAAIVEYRYNGGVGKAFLCEKCENNFNTPQLGLDDDLSI